MTHNLLDHLIPARRYGDESEEAETFVLAEVGNGEVDFVINPRTMEAVTISLSVEGTWKLIRQLAACAVAAGDDDA